MTIAILSDIHDNLWQLGKVLDDLRASAPDALIFCGDFCAPFTLKALAERSGCPVHAVFGNNDGDRVLLTQVAAQAGNVTLYGELAELALDGLRVAVSHYPSIAAPLLLSGSYDLVCTGHSHQWEERRNGTQVLVNPGEVMGRFGHSTYALFDTTTRELTRRAFPWEPV
jgi:putative phosphoesterase